MVPAPLGLSRPNRFEGRDLLGLPVLIEVPALANRPAKTFAPPKRRRRRVRREVRVACATLAVTLPLSWCLMALWTRPEESSAAQIARAAAVFPKPAAAPTDEIAAEAPWVSISLEPGVAVAHDRGAIGVRPAGFLLPLHDDGFEDTEHARR